MASNKHNNTLQYYTELLNKDKFDNGGMYLAKPKANVPYDPSSLNYYTQNNTTISQPVKFGNIAYKSSITQPKSSTTVVPQQLAPSHENDPKYQYFNPKEDVNATSGNKLEDMVYHNQWLLKTPIVGDIIKNKAREYASNSGRAPIITDDLSKMQQDKGNKYTGGEGKIDLLKQYFDKKGLTKSNYTPTSNYLNFLPSYSIKDNFNTMQPTDKNKLVQNMIDQQLNQTAGKYSNSKDPYSEAYSDFLKTKKPLYTQNDFDTDITNQLGVNLGGHKTGMAYDENVKLPYVSVSDAWDFSPDNYTKKWASKDNQDKARIQSTLMQKAGNPFKIYDRFYFDPNTKQYIPDDQVSQLKKKLGITPQMEQEQNVKSNVQSWLSSHKYANGGEYSLPKYEDGGSIDPYVKSWFSNPVTLNKLSSQLNSGDSSYFTKVANDAVQSLSTTLNKAKIFPINSTPPNISGNGQEEWNEDVNTAKNAAENKGYSRVSDSYFGILKNPNDNVKLSTILTGISNPMNYLNNKDKDWYPNIMNVRNKLNAVPGVQIKLQELDKIKNDDSYKYLKNIHGSDNNILNVLNTVAQNNNRTNNSLRI